MKDHHVDRPGVEVGQPMKLTGSDRPTGSDPVVSRQAGISDQVTVINDHRQPPTTRNYRRTHKPEPVQPDHW